MLALNRPQLELFRLPFDVEGHQTHSLHGAGVLIDLLLLSFCCFLLFSHRAFRPAFGLFWHSPVEQIQDLLLHDRDHLDEGLVRVVQFLDAVRGLLALVPHVGDHAAYPVNHLAHAEVLADQGALMVLPHVAKLDCQDLILLPLVVFERMVPQPVQLALKQEI